MTVTPHKTNDASTQGLTDGVVYGAPKLLLRLEGAGGLAAAVYGYSQFGSGWGLFALLFLVPDLSMLGYLLGTKIGAAAYNIGHSYLSPGALAVAGLLLGTPALYSIALIWIAHIGFDRTVGYGFKYSNAFKHTHLGTPFSRIGEER
jgi:Domain of unknown function (DUF4260)